MTMSRILLSVAFLASAGVLVLRVLDISQRGFEDFPIFYQAAQHYLQSGTLYPRNLEHYYPASGIYKFPSLYAGLLLVFIKAGMNETVSGMFLLALHLMLYVSAVALLIKIYLPPHKRWEYGLAMATIALAMYPLRDTLVTLQLEMYIFVGLVALLYLLRLKKYFSSGLVVGLLASLKIYPVFFLAYGFFDRRWSFFAGALAAALVSLSLMVLAVGWKENIWFALNALPVLLNEGAFVNHVNVGIEKLINHAFSQSQFIHWQTPLGVGSAAITKLWLWLAGAVAIYAAYRRRGEWQQPGGQLQGIFISLLCTLVLMALKNPWSNYQLILLIPLLLTLPIVLGETGSRFLRFLYFGSLALLWCAPSHISLVFTWLHQHAAGDVLWIFTMLNDRLFAWRGLATVFLYLLLVILLFRRTEQTENR